MTTFVESQSQEAALHELADNKVFYAFSQNNEPVLTIKSGETVRIKTKDCFGGQIQTPADELSEIDWDHINPATGAIYIQGAEAGGALKVDILSIEIDEQTSSCTGEDAGVCGDLFGKWSTHLASIKEDKLVWDDKVSIPLSPMIGVIGVAPFGEPVNCGTPGSHGGNMDNVDVKVGASLYFPVACEGALFGCGDLHAVMGDGEISVSGAEVSGHVTARFTAVKQLQLTNPLLEDDTSIETIASAESLDEAASIAVHDMVELVHARTGVAKDELVMLFSLVADVRVCQMVDPEKTVRFKVPKYILKAYGFTPC